MKAIKIALTLFSMVFFTTLGMSQTNKNADQENTEKIISHLNLSPEKASIAREIGKKYYEKMNLAKDDYEKKAITDETDLEIRKLLSEEEYKKYYAFITEQKNSSQIQSNQNKRPIKNTSLSK